ECYAKKEVVPSGIARMSVEFMNVSAKKTSFHDSKKMYMAVAASPGSASGSVTRQSAPSLDDPSIIAASSSSAGTALKKPISSQVETGSPNTRYVTISDPYVLVSFRFVHRMKSGMTTTATGNNWMNKNMVESARFPGNGKREKLYAASAARVSPSTVVAEATTALFWNQSGKRPWNRRTKLSSVGAVGIHNGGIWNN